MSLHRNYISIEVRSSDYRTLRAYLVLVGERYPLQHIELHASNAHKLAPFVGKWRNHAAVNMNLPCLLADGVKEALASFGVKVE